MKVNVPEGKSGDWEVRHVVVTEEDAKWHSLRCAFRPQRGELPVEPGRITQLLRRGSVIMSDTSSEMHDHSRFISLAHGDVLIAGLGLGMVTCAVAAKPEVAAVTVLEHSADVIKLVVRSLPATVDVRLADVFRCQPDPGRVWDCMWIDIWDCGCTDNLPEMARLRRNYCRRVKSRVMCWKEEHLRTVYRREQREERRWRGL